jgi:hypothetical protein
MSNCTNCNEPISGKYCSNCGQPTAIKRINTHYIIHEIEHILHLEKGILYTIKALLTDPGKNIRQFITENRSKLTKPVIFIIVTSLCYTFVIHFFHIKEGYTGIENAQSNTVTLINKWVQENYGYSNLIMGIFIAIWIKIFFRRYDYNLFEIFILLCFIMGMGMLIFAVFAIIQGITDINILPFAGAVLIVYCAWAIGHFFNKKKISSYLKALAAYMLGMITFSLSVIIIGTLTDLITKH